MSWSVSVLIALLCTSLAYGIGWCVVVPMLRTIPGKWVWVWARGREVKHKYVWAEARRRRATRGTLLVLLLIWIAMLVVGKACI